MDEIMTSVILASFGLTGLCVTVVAGLKGWQGWLEVRRMELSGSGRREPRGEMSDLIEMADLKERVRKLETIAACIDP